VPRTLEYVSEEARVNHSEIRALPLEFFETRSARDIFLAPHFDDVCFSLGALVSHSGHGQLLTLFSLSDYVENQQINFIIKGNSRKLAPEERRVVVGIVSRMRLVEERNFCNQLSLSLKIGGFVDSILRGRHPFNNSINLAAIDTPLFAGRIMELITAADHSTASDIKPWLFCPMGIGSHVDHLILRSVVVENIVSLRTRFRVAFYEDLPYASIAANWFSGVENFFSLHQFKLARHFYEVVDVDGKLDLIRGYASQLSSMPEDLARFSPVCGGPDVSYEAVWLFEEDLAG
jgi:hypothetical protein